MENIRLSNYIGDLANEFGLSDEERYHKMNNAGRQPLFNNRVGWAQTYLKKAGLLEAPRRGLYRITPRGLDVLNQKPDVITLDILLRYPEFVEFRSKNLGEERDPAGDPYANEKSTPDELLETGYRQMIQTLADDLLVKVKSCFPDFLNG